MIVLRTPKGWTGPAVVDGAQTEGTFRSHQVPLPEARGDADHRAVLEEWLRSYRPDELFDEEGCPVAVLRRGRRTRRHAPHERQPCRQRRWLRRRDLDLPDWREYAVEVPSPGATMHSSTRVLGSWIRDVTDRNRDRFLTFSPDELLSNRFQDVLDVTTRRWQARIDPRDDRLGRDGRAIELLSEHMCQGLLEGYVLTGRHGVFPCYEAFIHIVDSMFNQHAKWLEASSHVPWRRPLASFNSLLSSHVWRQDHNGNTHQDPGFLDVVCNKKPDIVRVYLPPDTNTLLSTSTTTASGSQHYVNVVVAGKQLRARLARRRGRRAALRAAGAGVWDWAGTEDSSGEVDVVLACAGDVPTLEALAAASILRERLPHLRVRFVNVVDLMRLQHDSEHPHGLATADFDALFTVDAPIVFAAPRLPVARAPPRVPAMPAPSGCTSRG